MKSLFRSFFTVSFYTFLSRVLGFIRDILIARYLGSTVIADAFFVAFRIPNFFRRVLAEGAYSAALIPVFSGVVLNPKDEREASDFVENTTSMLLFATVVLTIIFFFGMPYIIQVLAPGFTDNKEAYELAVHFGKIIFPYIIFISLAAHFASINNVHERFAAGAFAPAILNISFILSLFFLTPFVTTAGHALSYGVLIGGVLQFLYLYRSVLNFYQPRIRIPVLNEKLKNFFKLFLPGVMGSGVIQLNIVIGTIIASFLPVGAISHIYYADRLNQLPLAIFGIALGIVLLPSLSKAIKQSDQETTNNIQNRSIEFSLLISLPSAIGLFILAEPIIYILFERGAFVKEDTFYTAKVLSYFALGLPAYIIIKVLVSCFFAREDTKTPLYISIVSVITNVVLSLLLIGSMREMGIAVATAISAWVNALLLYLFLAIRNHIKFDYLLVRNSIKILLSSFLLFVGIYLLNGLFFTNISGNSVLLNSALLLLMIFLAIIIYFGLVIMLKVLSISQLREYLKK